jgi:transposase
MARLIALFERNINLRVSHFDLDFVMKLFRGDAVAAPTRTTNKRFFVHRQVHRDEIHFLKIKQGRKTAVNGTQQNRSKFNYGRCTALINLQR